jgi:hypothetical protein
MLRGLPFMKLQGVWSRQSTMSPSSASLGPAPPAPVAAPSGSAQIPEE